MKGTVVVVFEADDLFFAGVKLVNGLLQFKRVAKQAVQGGCELVQGGSLEGLLVEAGEDCPALFEHLDLQVFEEVGAAALLTAAVLLAQAVFVAEPAIEGAFGEFQGLGGELDIAVVAVDQVEGVDLEVEIIVIWHGCLSPLLGLIERKEEVHHGSPSG